MYSQSNKIHPQIPFPSTLFAVTLGNAPVPSTTSAVYAKMGFPLAEPAVMKAGCHKSTCKVFHDDYERSELFSLPKLFL